MQARYNFDEGESGSHEQTSITLKDSEIVNLIDELENELEIDSEKEDEDESIPVVSKLLRRLKELSNNYTTDEEDEGPDDNEDEEDETSRVVALAKQFVKDIRGQ